MERLRRPEEIPSGPGEASGLKAANASTNSTEEIGGHSSGVSWQSGTLPRKSGSVGWQKKWEANCSRIAAGSLYVMSPTAIRDGKGVEDLFPASRFKESNRSLSDARAQKSSHALLIAWFRR